MEVRAVDFVRYTVCDLSTALAFYRDTLGLTLEKHLDDVGWAEFSVPPTTLALEEADPDVRIDSNGSGAAVALAVEAAVDELRDEGTSILQEPIETGVCDVAKVGDPDGNRIVLHRRHDGTHGRKNPFP